MQQPNSRTDLNPHHAMADVVVYDGDYYVQASSALTGQHNLVLKQDETFAVFDSFGNIKPIPKNVEGVYHEGTRFLSGLLLKIGEETQPVLMSSTVTADNCLVTADLANPTFDDNGRKVQEGTLHLARIKFLWNDAYHQRLRIKNYDRFEVTTCVSFAFEADYVDIFEIRGSERERRGRHLEPRVSTDRVILGYEGLDNIKRFTRLNFTPAPQHLTESEAHFDITLPPGGETVIELVVSCDMEKEKFDTPEFGEALNAVHSSRQKLGRDSCRIGTSNELFNSWLSRARADLLMMLTERDHGCYLYGGVPWYSTAFGRDGIIAAWAYLWMNPNIARGTLRFLSATQAQDVNDEQDAQPGKIIHETRKGEMAALGEIPFKLYYGSIDSTLLYLLLMADYVHHTGDRKLLDELWPHVDLALKWIDDYGDIDGDGFIEYRKRSSHGLNHQGWKDSDDSLFHADGEPAQGSIALCEVQAYAYGALLGGADLVSLRGDADRARKLRERAEKLRENFEAQYWCDDLSIYAIALDGDKRPCRVRTSNAGQCLLTGIADAERARRLADTLMNDDMFCGWGIRTLACNERRYNPMSYHNGSIWPHDNALIANGLARYGLKEQAGRVLGGLFDASLFLDLFRLPELFCGFSRRAEQGPTRYPMACSPQVWAAASTFMLLQSCIGLHVDGIAHQVEFRQPFLPEFLPQVSIDKLRVGNETVDLMLQRHSAGDVGVNVINSTGPVEVVVVKSPAP
ncbi:MAG TPA: amylo-alpha-1,6-glucosidase [Gammaproteobacteria bacterium]|nr:amylo-alpha-1,6-glucosidase [Gammaproteobacteria bacterium]